MNLQPNSWSCLPTAFANVLGTTPAEIIELIGHDGSEIIYPGYPDPHCRRGFSVEELIDLSITLLRYPIEIPLQTVTCGPDGIDKYTDWTSRFSRYLERHDGILLSVAACHSVSWVNQKVLNPVGLIEDYIHGKYDIFIAML